MRQSIRFDNLKNYKGGWIMGAFRPNILRTSDFEIAIVDIKKGHISDDHYHEIATEYNVIVSGQGIILDNGVKRTLNDGDIFIVYPKIVVNIEYTKDTKLICIKTPSLPFDKYFIKKEDNNEG